MVRWLDDHSAIFHIVSWTEHRHRNTIREGVLSSVSHKERQEPPATSKAPAWSPPQIPVSYTSFWIMMLPDNHPINYQVVWTTCSFSIICADASALCIPTNTGRNLFSTIILKNNMKLVLHISVACKHTVPFCLFAIIKTNLCLASAPAQPSKP
jgi:hypothetical protein